MTRARALSRLLGFLAHAEADTAEGRAFGELATRLRARFGFTDEDIAAARVSRREDDRLRAELPGWGAPWLVVLASTLAGVSGVSCQIQPAPDGVRVSYVGPRAGRTARRAEVVRAMVERRVERLGGDEGVRRLPSRAMAFASTSATITFSYGGYRFGPPPTLYELLGEDCLDVYRLLVARGYLAPELDAEQRRRERKQAEAAKVAWAAARDASSRTSDDASTPASGDGPAPGEPAAPPPAPPAPHDPEEEGRALALAARVQRLLVVAQSVAQGRPSWAAPEPPEETALVEYAGPA